ncbi:hypothetical protein jhhlp_007172 [Lomentospora prolificans]|uniref:Uncharacterized protein n=1 Tax=Lomentospora prolificans TaxID=41688 RepID=A0A2N3N1W2_9PEZI|nr:hypothetical protein jhhlp_007172 [Lomentospora prolificans]
MASHLIRPARRLFALSTRHLRAPAQRRWAQVHDVRFLATAEPPRAVVERYREKLDQKAKEQGYNSLEELKTAYSGKIADVRQKDAVTDPLTPPPSDPSSPSSPSTTPSASTPTSSASRSASKAAPTVKPLSSILDLEKARTLPDKELTAIWRLRHAHDPQTLCAAISGATYAAMEAAARSAPQFVLPVPHPEQGAEIHFLEWTFDAESKTSTVLFTQLAEYKARGEFAQPHTTITHHKDLLDERGLVLMQGQVVENRGAKVEDARFLVLCLQKFYGAWEEAGRPRVERKQLLDWFAKGDSRFTIDKLLEETERMV